MTTTKYYCTCTNNSQHHIGLYIYIYFHLPNRPTLWNTACVMFYLLDVIVYVIIPLNPFDLIKSYTYLWTHSTDVVQIFLLLCNLVWTHTFDFVPNSRMVSTLPLKSGHIHYPVPSYQRLTINTLCRQQIHVANGETTVSGKGRS